MFARLLQIMYTIAIKTTNTPRTIPTTAPVDKDPLLPSEVLFSPGTMFVGCVHGNKVVEVADTRVVVGAVDVGGGVVDADGGRLVRKGLDVELEPSIWKVPE